MFVLLSIVILFDRHCCENLFIFQLRLRKYPPVKPIWPLYLCLYPLKILPSRMFLCLNIVPKCTVYNYLCEYPYLFSTNWTAAYLFSTVQCFSSLKTSLTTFWAVGRTYMRLVTTYMPGLLAASAYLRGNSCLLAQSNTKHYVEF